MNIFRDNRSINGAARRLVEFESALFCRTYPRLASRSVARPRGPWWADLIGFVERNSEADIFGHFCR